jgi:adenylate cyclase
LSSKEGQVLEIERQFLIRRIDPTVFTRAERIHSIRQGYLTLTSPAIRVRQIDDRTVMTVKAGGGLVRREVEFDIAAEIATELFDIAGSRTIQKTRYVLGGWELDVFEGRHAGLLIGETELDDPDDPTPPLPLGVELWREVTHEQGFTNQFLASLDEGKSRELVEHLSSDFNAAIEWVRRNASPK